MGQSVDRFVNRIIRRCVWIITCLSLCLSVGEASALELDIQGILVWNYRYFSQLSNHGFYGLMDVDSGFAGAADAGKYAPYNFWAGWHRNAGIVSGVDANWQTMWMDTHLDLRPLHGVRVSGRYHVGEWLPDSTANFGTGDLVHSEYLNSRYSGLLRAISPGYWVTLWGTVNLPIGTLQFGKRKSVYGIGLGWDGEYSRSIESVQLVVPYGPFRITLGAYPARRGTTLALATTARQTTGSYYNRDRDKNNARLWDIQSNFVYTNGPFETGVYSNFLYYHRGGEGIIDLPSARITNYTYLDSHSEVYGAAYLKFINGRFFFNAEVDWFLQREQVRGARPFFSNPGWNFKDFYIEHCRYAVETGLFAGSAKLSLVYAYLSGGDRRGDQLGRVGQIDHNPILNSSQWSNTGFFRPYSLLMNYVYGTGVFQCQDTTNGFIEDAVVCAARLDHAAAANLNLFLSFMWAQRASKSGFGWGCIRPDTTRTDGTVDLKDIFIRFNVPNIPETDLGYELDTGFDWKLLENLVANLTVAYWNPGKWFRWACVDKGLVNWGSPIVPASWIGLSPSDVGVNPDRSIDPIWGVELKLNLPF